jgi:signal transduction histidine kinase/ActR/RegA family two-component response regulator
VRNERPTKSLAAKFCRFTALLLGWFFAVEIAVHLYAGVDFNKAQLVFSVVLIGAAVLIAKVTSGVFVRPLILLNEAITGVKEGKLEPIRISSSGDEIEKLGESFNEMITALAASRRQVIEHQEHLELKIQERTMALAESMKRAEAASEAKSGFLANMSHELRTPLNGIIGMIDIVLATGINGQQREELEIARESAFSLLALVNDILDISKIEAGRLSLENIPFSPRKLVDDGCKLISAGARQKGLNLTWEVESQVPAWLVGDPLRIQQILANLLGNAVKYTPHGRVDVRASSRPVAPGVIELRFDVKDTGIGIPQHALSTIFRKFTQADNSNTRKYGGTGLGLAIAQELADMYRGGIRVESEEGRGSTFHVTLELREAEPAAAGIPDSVVPDLAGIEAANGVRARILVVEDNAVNQKVVTKLLGKRGYRTEVAGNGREALAALERSTFDVVLMDLQMPVMDGLEATRLIRLNPRWRTLPVIGLTAHATAEGRDQCLKAGMDEYVTKPIRASALWEAVDKALSRRTSGAAIASTVSQ